jgi:type I restriction enzyme M protein
MNTQEIGRSLFKAADTLRGEFDAVAFGEILLPLVFLKYVSGIQPEGPAGKRGRFSIPSEARFEFLLQQRRVPGNAKRIAAALQGLEKANEGMAGAFAGSRFEPAEIPEGSARDQALGDAIATLAQLDSHQSSIQAPEPTEALRQLVTAFPPDLTSYAGELYTPPKVMDLLTQLVAPKPGEAIYDPACGAGGFLFKCADSIRTHNPAAAPYSLWGQDSTPKLLRFAKMSALLRGETQFQFAADDIFIMPFLGEDKKPRRFDVIVSNPPFSSAFSDPEWAAVLEDRFGQFKRGRPPRNRADYGYILHMIESVNPQTGRIATIAPRGALFREGSEADIRKNLVETNLLDAVIGLPPKLFQHTEIPAVILVFRAKRKDDRVLFIDASREFDLGRKSNELRSKDLERIITTYRQQPEIPGYSRVVSAQEIASNDYNLNISPYVNTAPEEPRVDLRSLEQTQRELYGELDKVRDRIESLLDQFLGA